MIDEAAVRADTPGVANVAHLNNAGAALPPRQVVDRTVAHLRREADIGGYEAAFEARTELEDVYRSIAALVNCAPDEVALMESATAAWHSAFGAVVETLEPGQRILIGRAEYASGAIAILQAARRRHLRMEVIEDDPDGQISLDHLAAALERGDAGLVALTHVPTQGGLVNPAAEVGKLANAAGVPYLLDACQSAGQLPLDVAAIGCDFLAATGRKFLRGPRGTGFLIVRRSRLVGLEPPVLDLHGADWTADHDYEMRDDARRHESWESSIAGRLGLGTAVSYALDLGIDAIESRVTHLGDRLRDGLRGIDRVEVCDRGARLCGGIVGFRVERIDPVDVVIALHRANINIHLIEANNARLDLEARGIDVLNRASPHYYNNEAEIDLTLEAVAALPR